MISRKEYFRIGLEEGQNDLEDCLESDHDEDDECDEKRRKVSKVCFHIKQNFSDISAIL